MRIKMKKITRILSLVLCALLLFSAAACAKKGQSGGTVLPPPQEEEGETISSTGEKLFAGGQSDYTIVIPSDADEYEEFASSELNYFLNLAAGITLPVQTDEDVEYSSSSKFLSIGDTSFLSQSGKTFDYNELGDSGYRVVTAGSTVFMAGARSEGTLYAVYDFLKYTVGYEFYAEDEIVVDSLTEADILAFDLQDIPAIQRRSLGYKPLWDSATLTRRLRLVDFSQDFIIDGHTFGTILPSEDYQDHEDWFEDVTNPNSQPCLTNPDARKQFIENCKTLITQHYEGDGNGRFFMLGQNDNAPFCNCTTCAAARERHNGRISGVLLDFVNAVTEELDAWLAETYPGRQLTYPTYAYVDSMEAPITFNNSTGTYNEPTVRPREDVVVMITPLSANWTYSFSDSRNTSLSTLIRSWGEITDNLYIYSYCVNFTQYFIPYNNYNILAENYRVAADYNMYAYYEQGANQSATSGLMELKFYLISNLLWDPYQDADALAEKFIRQYYGPVADYMLQYYKMIRIWYGHLQEEIDPPFQTSIYADICQEKYWPFNLVNNWQKNIFDAAYESLESLRQSDPDNYEKYYNRVKKENLTLTYLFVQLHSAQFTNSELAAMIDEFERYTALFQLNYYQEGEYTRDLLETWRRRF